MKYIPILIVLLFVPLHVYGETYNISILDGSDEPNCNPCFSNKNLVIKQGDKVIWDNEDQAAHTITSGNSKIGPDGYFDSALFLGGDSWGIILTRIGDFPYYCMVHPWMKGVIHVESNTNLKPNTNQTIVNTYMSDTEEDYLIRITDLTSENNLLKNQVLELEQENFSLKEDNQRFLGIINNLEQRISNLNLIIGEQIKVIYDWVVSK